MVDSQALKTVYKFAMNVLHRLLINLALAASLMVLFYAFFTGEPDAKPLIRFPVQNVTSSDQKPVTSSYKSEIPRPADETLLSQTMSNNVTTVPTPSLVVNSITEETDLIHFWIILTKVETHSSLKTKFEVFLQSIVKYMTSDLALHAITDKGGKLIIEEAMELVKEQNANKIKVQFYNVGDFVKHLQPLVTAMQPHFSSAPDSYYSDSLFYLSLGLHKVAPHWMSKCVMIDIDTEFRDDPSLLWSHFDNFSSTELFGLAPELSPVYRHALYAYRTSLGPHTRIGEPHSEGGNSGLNSGVVLLNLERLRSSKAFSELCQSDSVASLVKKYKFRGHLGDQDFYTLISMEREELVYLLPCTWNRQLCTWWRDHGYAEVFSRYFKCSEPVSLYHGNCNSQIPA